MTRSPHGMLEGVYGVANKLEMVPSLLAKNVWTSNGCSSETESIEPDHWAGTPAWVEACAGEDGLPCRYASGGSAIVWGEAMYCEWSVGPEYIPLDWGRQLSKG